MQQAKELAIFVGALPVAVELDVPFPSLKSLRLLRAVPWGGLLGRLMTLPRLRSCRWRETHGTLHGVDQLFELELERLPLPPQLLVLCRYRVELLHLLEGRLTPHLRICSPLGLLLLFVVILMLKRRIFITFVILALVHRQTAMRKSTTSPSRIGGIVEIRTLFRNSWKISHSIARLISPSTTL